MTKMRAVLAQLNFLVGDLPGNLNKHLQAAVKARDDYSADIIIFPELSLCGYPAEDLLLRKDFISDTQVALQKFILEMKGIYCLIGHPHATSQGLYNACSLVYNGTVIARYHKQQLPNYGVFDEARYFIPGDSSCIVNLFGIPTALLICEDLWRLSPARDAVKQGAKLILSPNASPFETDKYERRLKVLEKRAKHHHTPILYVNQIGGQDDLIFDGGSLAINAKGDVCQCAPFFQENLMSVDIDMTGPTPTFQHSKIIIPNDEEKIYQALTLSLYDYVKKNKFRKVLLGLSGGIDSALTLTIACDALGSENVHALILPSRHTAKISIDDATALVDRLKVSYDIISIEPTYQSFIESLKAEFKDKTMDVTEENIQARCRAILLMALSNKFGYLVLSTGNRSELAVGYCTLYGDMAGGFSVLKDIPKTLVYQLARYRNTLTSVIPTRTIDRPPTAELAPDQKDEDTLPPYAVLDSILDYYLNQGKSIEEIVQLGFTRAIVSDIVQRIKKNEYKRRQAATGPRINHHAFSKDWRFPITNGFKG